MTTENGTLDIAIGMSAGSRKWKNKKIQWSDFVVKLTTPIVTPETYKEFITAAKKDQDKIKDVGGYVGGYVRGGRRKAENIVYRQLLTLDIDFAHKDFWDDFQLIFGCAAVMHGTHKHTTESPRLRLIIPLDREVNCDEYVAIGRKVAGTLGIDLFDNTTFQPQRLMYWPSASCDKPFYYEVQDGEWLDADEVLNSYADWKDSSLWPTAAASFDDVLKTAKKQQDPEQKKGVIGAFCRTFSITEAIEKFLGEDYGPSTIPDRYTYLKGSTAAGLVVYEDKFAYSHHGTDPSGGMLCNAFDLVRVHKFGHLDKDSEATGSKAPSFLEMSEFALTVKEVKLQLAKERRESISADFSDNWHEDENEDAEEGTVEDKHKNWEAELETDSKGRNLPTAGNFSLVIRHDDRLRGIFRENMFDNKRYLFRTAPWRKINQPEPLRNVDYSGVRNYVEIQHKISSSLKMDDALAIEFEDNSFHPITDYLNGLKWDGVKRVDTLLIDYFNTEDNTYTREAIRKTLVGAVARVMRPGVKFDLVLTLVGGQGTGKSTFVSILGKQWFSDTFSTVNGKESFEQLQGAWLIEMAELSGLKKAEIESIKHFISKREDSFRPAFGRTVETYKRQCVFIGTTNKWDFLNDPSGNRRFMPVDIGSGTSKKNVFDDLEDEVDQVWAEATHLYRKGEKLYLGKVAEAIATQEQIAHSFTDERTGLISAYLDMPLPVGWEDLDIYDRRQYVQSFDFKKMIEEDDLIGKEENRRDEVCIAEIWAECMGKEKHEMDRYKTRDINEIMRGLEGWKISKATKNFPIYGKQKYYFRTK